jgi:uncharacterized protein (DUF697 family)
MWKALINKIFKKAKTAEGAAGIGGALFGGWLGSSMGIAAPSLIPAIFGTAITGIFPVAAVGAGFGYLAVKIIKYKRKLHEIEEKKKKYGWLISLKKFYNMGFFLHLILIFMLYVMIVGWGTVCANIGLSDSILELIIIWPLFIIILLDIACIILKIFKRSFNID